MNDTDENAVQRIVDNFAPREARVEYPDDWPSAWAGKPWPWCRKAEHEVYKVPFDFSQGLITIPAVPHDTHIDNGGNTWCPGVPGIIPAPSTNALVESIARGETNIERLRKQLADEEEITRQRAEALRRIQERGNKEPS